MAAALRSTSSHSLPPKPAFRLPATLAALLGLWATRPTAPIRRKAPRIGRNAPCPCGASKMALVWEDRYSRRLVWHEIAVKYKRCHGRQG